MTEYLITIQLKTTYTIPVLAKDTEHALDAALEQSPPEKLIDESKRIVKRIMKLTQTSNGLRYVEEKREATMRF